MDRRGGGRMHTLKFNRKACVVGTALVSHASSSATISPATAASCLPLHDLIPKLS